MADFDGAMVVNGAGGALPFPALVDPVIGLVAEMEGLRARRMDDLDTIVLTKTTPGFSAAHISAVRELLADAKAGRLGRLKFLAFEFVHEGEGAPSEDDGFHVMLGEVANLILSAPIVTVACARGRMAGADLEFALACSMLVGERGARFSFAADPIVSIGTYGFLAQKIGFVRAERLMEEGEVLDVEQMQALLLLKSVSEDGGGVAGLEHFLRRTARRHNSCYGIYRAQRITSPAMTGRMGAVA
ncbi:MAG: hypothetical protein ABIO39_08840 [Caulobacteraceae bacterium]